MAKKLTIAELVVHVEAHAVKNYEKDGWDIWVEAWSTAEKEELVADAKTKKSAIKIAAAELKLLDDNRREIEGTGEAQDEEKPRGSVISAEKKKAYGTDQCNRDSIAWAMKAQLTSSSLAQIGDENGIDVLDRWGHLNPGMQRMNLGNVLRGMVKKSQDVTIGGTLIKGTVS